MSHPNRVPDPSRSEILNRAKEIREGWTDRQEQQRQGKRIKAPPYTIPQYKVVVPKDPQDQFSFECMDGED